MRQFEYAVRGFINIDEHCIAQSIALGHDCYPLDRQTAERMRTTTFWSGDVWRLIPILRKCRLEPRVHPIATPPTGLELVLRSDSTRIAVRELEKQAPGVPAARP